jgi:hypothetical protein
MSRCALSITLGLTLAVVACSDGSSAPKPSGLVVTPTGTYTDLQWPPGTYSSFEWTLRVQRDPSPAGYFWAHQFHFAEGDGGYLGLQTLGGDPAKPPGKVAIFSIWNALSADGPGYSGPFGGEGSGYTARIDYPWTVGRDYRLRIQRIDPAGEEAGWGAWVRDEVTQHEELVGRIKVPGHWGLLSSTSILWTERYAGEASSCSDLGFSEVSFTSPKANNGAVVPSGTKNHLSDPPGSCRNSKIEDLSSGVRHQMGKT